MANFVTRFAALTVLFVLPGVAEGQDYYLGNSNMNLCPVGSEQVLSVSACQEASGDLGYSYAGLISVSGEPRGERGKGGGRWRQPGRGGEGGGSFEARSWGMPKRALEGEDAGSERNGRGQNEAAEGGRREGLF
jgi:hypothetical protein